MDTSLLLLPRQRRHGDADAFGALVRDHAGMVFATAKRVTGDATLAEDVAQETFLELARHGHAAVESVAAWLYRVAWRKACNAVRGEARRRRHEETAAKTLHVVEEAPWKDLEPVIDEVLEELPARVREFLVEHYLEGRTQQEMASRMGISQSAVSRQLDAGLHELRSRLRAKGVLGVAGLAALLGVRAEGAVPSSLHASLGKLAMSGAGTGASVTPGVAVSATLFTMSITKIVLATAATVVLVGTPLVFLHQGSTAAKPAPATLPAKVTPPVRQTADAKAQVVEPRRHWSAPVSAAVRMKVDAIIRRHRGMSQEELLKDDELHQITMAFGVLAGLDSPEMQRKVEDAIKGIRATKGGEEHGMLQMDFGEVDSPEFRSWAEAAVSGDPEQAQSWILDRLQGAVFEFALDPTLERTSDGVSVHPQTPGKSGANDQKTGKSDAPGL